MGPGGLFPPARVGNKIEIIAVSLILFLAFWLASSPVRHSDFWLHLATGRALWENNFLFGVEPFSYSNRESYWVNPSWLFEVALYFSYQTVGGAGLVVLKGMVTAILAAFLVFTGRTGKSFSVSVLSTSLALVAMGPWLALKPVCFSLLFLGATIWFLDRRVRAGEQAEDRQKTGVFSCWPLLALFALWANLDRWFFLGPLTVAGYFLGAFLARKAAPSGRESDSQFRSPLWKNLGLLFLSGLAVCLINPHHVWIFQAPCQLGFSEVADNLQQDPFLRTQFFVPFREIYFFTNPGLTPPTAAFWLLTVLSFLSFFLDFNSWPWQRWLTWAVFFLLCLWQIQALPFFAIVAAPILAGNLEEFSSRQRSFFPFFKKPFFSRSQRALAFLVVLFLVVAAWPGWLQPGRYGPRRWEVLADPSLEQAAEKIASWQEQGQVPKNLHFFNYSPEAGNHLAWLYPKAKCAVNSHFHLSPAEAADYVRAREGLLGQKPFRTPARSWRTIFRESQVQYLFIYSSDLGANLGVIQNLLPAFRECPLLFLQGRSAIFGWREKSPLPEPDPFIGLELNLRQAAFSPSSPNLAPARPSEPFPRPYSWWDAFWRVPAFSSPDRDEAAVFLNSFDSFRERWLKKNFYFWESTRFGGLVAAGASTVNPVLEGCVQVAPNPRLQEAFFWGLDEGPVDFLYLALRAARRALQKNPDDPQNYLLLGEIYFRLGQETQERNWTKKIVPLAKIRTAQALAAFNQVIELDPASGNAHFRLAELFQSLDYKDLALQHYRILTDKNLSRRPFLGESGQQFAQRQARMAKQTQKLGAEVQLLQEKYDLKAANLRVGDRAALAGSLGLAGKALDILLASDLAAFGKEGLGMELKMLVNTGHPRKAKSWLVPEHEKFLGPENYHWIKSQIEAALGNYQAAEEDLQALAGIEILGTKLDNPRALAGLILGNTFLIEAGGGFYKVFPLPTLLGVPTIDFLPGQMLWAFGRMNQDAKMALVRALLALEAGRMGKARHLFREALTFWNSPAGEGFKDAESVAGRRMAQFWLETLNLK